MLRSINRVAWLFALLGGLAAMAVAGMTVVSIVGRALFGKPIEGDVELTQFGIAVCISLCLPWCQVHGGNIIVDFFTQNRSARSRAVLDAIGALMLTAMTALLAWRSGIGAIAVGKAGETSMLLGLPTWWNYALVAPGLALTGLIALIQAVLLLRGRDIAELQR